MNCLPNSQTPQQLSFDPTPEGPGDLLFRLEVPGRLASWNEILGMEQWARYKYKQELADAFLSVLRATASGSLTKTTSAANTWLIYADTLERYLAMRQEQRRLRSRNKRLARKSQSAPSLKSSDLGKVPF